MKDRKSKPKTQGKQMNLDELDSVGLRRAANVFATLQTYAIVKARAVEARLAGKIAYALTQEQECERLYDEMPDWAQDLIT